MQVRQTLQISDINYPLNFGVLHIDFSVPSFTDCSILKKESEFLCEEQEEELNPLQVMKGD